MEQENEPANDFDSSTIKVHETLSPIRPSTLTISENEAKESLHTASSVTSSRSDISGSSFTSEEFRFLRDELDMDMGEGDPAAEIFDRSDIEIDVIPSPLMGANG